MIPPSTVMVIYGIVTQTNIGHLAGVIPGLLTAAMLMLTVMVMTARDPEHAPPGQRASWPERWRALRGIWGVVVLVVVVLGGICGGFFTATEGAGFGTFGAFLFALLRRRLSWRCRGPAAAQRRPGQHLPRRLALPGGDGGDAGRADRFSAAQLVVVVFDEVGGALLSCQRRRRRRNSKTKKETREEFS